jgi:engulfment and cell motility protein 1
MSNPLLSSPSANTLVNGNSPLGPSSTATTNKRWRYYKLSRSKRSLMYGDFSEKIAPVLKAYEKLPHRIDLGAVHEIRSVRKPSTAGLVNNSQIYDGPVTSSSTRFNNLSFALYTEKNVPLAEFHCENAPQAAEWKDGFSMLLDKRFTSKETAELFHTLTEVGVKVKLLQIAGDRVEIPHGVVEVPPVPPGLGTGFFYDSIEL